MSRKPATTQRQIPLFLVPHIVMRGVRAYGDDLERVIVRKVGQHYYNISIRTRTINREQRPGTIPAGKPAPDGTGYGSEGK
ncbi:MAG: hypothetical protein WC391_08160 [Methanoregula sp.]